MLRWLAGLLLVSLLVAGAAFWFAGRGATAGHHHRTARAGRRTGRHPRRRRRSARRTIHLADRRARTERPHDSAVQPRRRPAEHAGGLQQGAEGAAITQTGPDTVRVSRPLGKQSVPELQQGAARIAVAASRPSFLNLRTLSSTAAKDFQVRLDPPRLAVVSTQSLCEPRRRRDDRVSRDAARRRIGRPRRRSRVSGLSAARRRSRR